MAAAFAAVAHGGLLDIYIDRGAFESAAAAAGKSLKFIETFEEGNVPAGGIAFLVSPLSPGVPNIDTAGLGFPTGLDATNLEIRTGSGGPLVALGDNFVGNTSTVVGANYFTDTTAIHLLPDAGKTAVGFNVSDPIGGTGDYNVTVHDPNGNLLFAGVVSAGAQDGSFMGFINPGGIGSIEIGAANDGGELIDNIQVWVPAPGAFALLGIAGLTSRRRRRT